MNHEQFEKIFSNAGRTRRPFMIAEISGNAGSDIQVAKNLIAAAKHCGADAVKIQTYTADTMTLDSTNPEFLLQDGLWKGKTLYELYKWAHTPWEWHQELFDYAKEVEIPLFSTPFDETAVDFLTQFDPPCYKVASFEFHDLPLIERIAKEKKPMILSTGMASEQEIKETIECLNDCNVENFIILHCVSAYPTPANKMNLKRIHSIRDQFGCRTGLSDHSLGTQVPVTAVGLGICCVEKHFVDDRGKNAADSAFSLEPAEFKTLVEDVDQAWKMLGNGQIDPRKMDNKQKKFRRSIYFAKDLKKGDLIDETSIKKIRPGLGMDPKFFKQLIGKKLKEDVSFASPVTPNVVEGM